ncbi:hypothetical protein CHS0354_023579 [Potamilus streckersoni]|nr:hypothetical protein CHS0354_023579 [Potamilus streckersoni]
MGGSWHYWKENSSNRKSMLLILLIFVLIAMVGALYWSSMNKPASKIERIRRKLSVSVDCQFEDDSLCGYTHRPNNPIWQLRSGDFFQRPPYDHTYGNATGKFLVAQDTTDLARTYNILSNWGPGFPYKIKYESATLMSPNVSFTTESCVYFYYYLNGTAVRPNHLSSQLYVYVNDGARRLGWYDSINRTIDGWLLGWVTVHPGAARIIFKAKTVTSTTVWPGIVALDDVFVKHEPCPPLPECGADSFKCTIGSICIPVSLQCDGGNDCRDGSDEANCNIIPNYQLMLTNGDGSFGSIAMFLNGIWRPVCMPRSDVMVGSSDTVRLACLKMGYTGRYQGSYVNSWPQPVKSAMQVNCSADYVDISQCSMTLVRSTMLTVDCYYFQAAFCSNDVCFSGEKLCPTDHCNPANPECSSTKKCISHKYFCDGISDCPCGTDELNCGDCKHNEFECANHACIHKSRRCDGTPQCGDKSDEYGCVKMANNKPEVYYSPFSDLYPVCHVNDGNTLANILCSLSGQGSSVRVGRSQTVQHAIMLTPQPDGPISLIPGYKASMICCNLMTIRCRTTECGTTTFHNRRLSKVLHGRVVEVGMLPWQVAVYENGEFVCGGTIIHSRWVVTASHCTKDLESYSVRVGAVEIENNSTEGNQGQLYDSSRTYNHEDFYSTDLFNDISLLYMRKEIAFKDNVRPLCMASRATVAELLREGTNAECYVSGWGNHQDYINRGKWEGKLRMVRVHFFNKTVCEERHAATGDLTPQDNTICTDNPNFGSPTCNRDSGAPLVCRNKHGRFVMVGLLSWGHKSCFIDGFPNVYQLSYAYDRWIKEKTGLDYSDLTMDLD